MRVYVGRIFDMSIFLNWLLQHIMCIYIYEPTWTDDFTFNSKQHLGVIWECGVSQELGTPNHWFLP